MPCTKCEDGKYKWGINGMCAYDTEQECIDANEGRAEYTTDIVELVIDEKSEDLSIDAISIVTAPAIEVDFVYFNKQRENLTLAKVDKEKKLLIGAALVPNKPIFRKSKDEDYYIFFNKDTVRKASQMFFKNGNQSKATLEHDLDVEGLTVVESWIVESEKDKSRHYGLQVPIGSWMISMKVDNDKIWNDYVKTGKIKGFSIEAFMSDRMMK